MTIFSSVTSSRNLTSFELIGGVVTLTGTIAGATQNKLGSTTGALSNANSRFGGDGNTYGQGFPFALNTRLGVTNAPNDGSGAALGTTQLSGAFMNNSGTVIQALNFLYNQVTAGVLGSGSVSRSEIASNAVGSEQIVTGSVIAGKIALDAVHAPNISFMAADLGTTDGHILVADGSEFTNVAVSGDVTISNTGAITIANDAVENAMIADDAVDTAQIADDAVEAAQLASNAVVNDSVAANAAIAFTKLAALSDGNILVGNGSNQAASVAMSGDIGIDNSGATTIQANAVEGSMLNANVAGDGLTISSNRLLISGTVNKDLKFGVHTSGDTPGRGNLQISGSNDNGQGRYFALSVTAGILTVTDIGDGGE